MTARGPYTSIIRLKPLKSERGKEESGETEGERSGFCLSPPCIIGLI